MLDGALTKKDFESGQEVRWCPGCGDYSILATVQRLLPELDIPRENHVFVSGIGCASRFPYYMNTYGFHTIHGRGPAVATGLKITNPELCVWLVTGDGDALSIGGNHLMHLFRRNPDITVLLFNNRIYGLTKGQYSPTSEQGKFTKSTPYGSLEEPVDPISLALASRATFVGRGVAVDAKGLADVLRAAHAHKGTSFVEIFQNCNVFNDGAFDDFAERKMRKSQQVQVSHGEPLIFGEDSELVISFKNLTPEVVRLSEIEDNSQLLKYDQMDRRMAMLLSSLPYPEFPVPMGVLFREERSTYEEAVQGQIAEATSRSGKGDLGALLESGDTWRVEA